MLRYSRPRRLIEVGSGYSSQVTLETNRRFLGNSIECVFIEPFPSDSLKAAAGSAIIQKRIQDVPLDTFSVLSEGDILFIDSTHVSKVGSDVNHIFFRILPMLRSGVRVHFHDVFYPFEYPEGWILEGKTWNEDYLLRAFLQFNSDFEIELFPNYLIALSRRLLPKKDAAVSQGPGRQHLDSSEVASKVPEEREARHPLAPSSYFLKNPEARPRISSLTDPSLLRSRTEPSMPRISFPRAVGAAEPMSPNPADD
jgi:hypothetical protein